jgi:hypothetical protein
MPTIKCIVILERNANNQLIEYVPLTEEILRHRCNDLFQTFRLETDKNMEGASNRNFKTMKYKLSENRDFVDNNSSSMHFCLDDFVDYLSPLPKTYEDDGSITIQPLEQATLQVGDMRNNNSMIKEDIFQDDLDVAYNKNSKCSSYAYQKENVITEMENIMSMLGNHSLVDKFLTLYLNKVSEKNSSLQDITLVQITQPVRSNIKRWQNLRMFIASHRNKEDRLHAQIRDQDFICKREIQELNVVNDLLLKQSQSQLQNFNDLQIELEGCKLDIKLRDAEIGELKVKIKELGDSNELKQKLLLFNDNLLVNQTQRRHLEADEVNFLDQPVQAFEKTFMV